MMQRLIEWSSSREVSLQKPLGITLADAPSGPGHEKNV